MSFFEHASNFSLYQPVMNNVEGDVHVTNNWVSDHVPAIRDWLNPPDPSVNLNAASEKRTPGTGQWLLSDPTYLKWKNSEIHLLWIQGKVGSGKPVLSQSQSMVCFYYFDNRDNSGAKANYRGFLLSILFQMAICQDKLHPALHNLYKNCKNGSMQASLKDLENALAEVVRDMQSVYIILDAMDECSQTSQVLNLLGSHSVKLHVAVTSRHGHSGSSQDCSTIQLNSIDADISLFLDERLEKQNRSQSLHEEIQHALLEGAQGQFRWVDCQLNTLEKCVGAKAIRKVLRKLPRDLEETYSQAMERIANGEQRDEAHHLLLWLTYAFVPLSIEEVEDIVTVDIEEQSFNPLDRPGDLTHPLYNIIDSSLVIIGPNHFVQLAHNSVKEFLISSHNQVLASGLLEFNEQLAHEVIAETCIIYLLHFNTQDEAMYLADYAAMFWPDHLRNVESIKQRVMEQYRYRFPWEGSEPLGTPLYYAAENGLIHVVLRLLPAIPDINAQGGEYETVLQAAVSSGQEIVVHHLLEYRVGVNSRSELYPRALSVATAEGHQPITLDLLEYGANVKTRSGFSNETLLYIAVILGHVDTVHTLLRYGADANVQCHEAYRNAVHVVAAKSPQTLTLANPMINGEYHDETPLYLATIFGLTGVAHALLKHGADVNAQGGFYSNALYAAVAAGHQTMVCDLLEHGADVNARGKYQWKALCQAVLDRLSGMLSYELGIVHELLEHGADVNAQCGIYPNALYAAVVHGHRTMVQEMLEHEADVNARGGKYETPLCAAAHLGHSDIVHDLLEYGADINAQCHGDYANALYAAAVYGHQTVVHDLVEHGANVNAQGGVYGYALHAAATRGYYTVVSDLLEHGADVHAQDREYGNALHAAAAEGHEEVVCVLIKYGADINAHGGFYGNALHAAAAQGHENVVHHLLEHGADHTQIGIYGNALQAAVLGGHTNVVHDLLEHGAEISTTLLYAAAAEGHNAIVLDLIVHGADVNYQSGPEYGNALYAAALWGHRNVVLTLLVHGADVNAQGGLCVNALCAAAIWEHRDVVLVLLEHDIDVDTQLVEYGNKFSMEAAEELKNIVAALQEYQLESARYGNALLLDVGEEQITNSDDILDHSQEINRIDRGSSDS
ncbi:ankyrin repeat-containing domain protein [Rhodocollybia butyracea]|uniref:Ankyrin repeat-containing domain protein n=1 Tax=Rhodocollybia butyracea TaxID=206335 RepID=A0A9P5U0H0_9AGAR|nr:ankyrin repeat-containing domain protein [Rhodocollybia butyracea]